MNLPYAGRPLVSCPDPNHLSAFVARTLGPEERAACEGHLDGCVVCLSAVTEMARSLASEAGAVAEVPAPGEPALPHEESGTVFGRYTILEVLGRGGMGTVYLAHDGKLDRDVALKVLLGTGQDHEAAARLAREARLMARLAHPNIVTVYDTGEVDGRAYISMELVAGQTLAAWLQSEPRSLDAILEVFRTAGDALAAAHAAGIVHRDFKPENVLLDGSGRVAVTDFGLASGNLTERPLFAGLYRAGSSAEETNITRTGALLGTPRYMSAEQHRGAPAGPASDQFSFAVALYEAVYRQSPFTGEKLEDRRQAVMAGRLAKLPEHTRRGVPAWLHAVLVQALSRDPAARFPDMDCLVLALYPPQRKRRTLVRPGFVVAFAAALLAAVTAFAMGLGGGKSSATTALSVIGGGAAGAGQGGTVDPPRALPAAAKPPAAPPPNVPTVYFVLDNSGGMNRGSKWTNVRRLVENVERNLGARAAFGAAMFPGNLSSNWACAPGNEVYAPTLGDDSSKEGLGDAASGPVMPPHLGKLLHALDVAPRGATPAAATLLGLRSELSTLRRRGPIAVVLVTDGGATCGGATACEAHDCATNVETNFGCTPEGPSCCTAAKGLGRDCLDDGGVASAVSELRLAGVPTFVVGVDPLPRYRVVLDAIAHAGGAARRSGAPYYDVAEESVADRSSALRADLSRTLGL
jgi:predicted Ser/Thr protein kinase